MNNYKSKVKISVHKMLKMKFFTYTQGHFRNNSIENRIPDHRKGAHGHVRPHNGDIIHKWPDGERCDNVTQTK